MVLPMPCLRIDHGAMKTRTLGSSVLISVILVLFGLEVYSLTVDYKGCTSPLPLNHGNFQRVRDLLCDDGKAGEFSFAVVGTAGGFGTFDRICSQLADEPLSFVVLLGDFVNKGTAGDHRFYRRRIGEPCSFSRPVFYCVGNREIDKGLTFTLGDFERIYGPSNVSFSYQGDLFIILRTFPYKTTGETLAFLEHELSAKRVSHDRVFVFSHLPLYRSPDFPSLALKDSEKYRNLLRKYHVDYAFSGDHQGYTRVTVDNVNYIDTGCGGSGPVCANEHGSFHHAVLVKVKGNSTSERILGLEKEGDCAVRMEHFAMACLSPWIMEHKVAAMTYNISGVTLLLLLVLYLLREESGGRA